MSWIPASDFASLNAMEINTLPLRRWDAKTGESTDWNDLRKDPELWFENGDCFVFLYQNGNSLRGPSFRIPLVLLELAGCGRLMDMSLISQRNASPFSECADPVGESFLFLHAPENLSREQTYLYHITTRNFFAWLTDVPLVGADPVSAVLDLKQRMGEWRDESADNLTDILGYMRSQTYDSLGAIEPAEETSSLESADSDSELPATVPEGFQYRPTVPLRMSSMRVSSKSIGRPRIRTTQRGYPTYMKRSSSQRNTAADIKISYHSLSTAAVLPPCNDSMEDSTDVSMDDRTDVSVEDSTDNSVRDSMEDSMQSASDKSDSIFSSVGSPASSTASSISETAWPASTEYKSLGAANEYKYLSAPKYVEYQYETKRQRPRTKFSPVRSALTQFSSFWRK